jgi:RNA-splicing ligase RtcB
MSIIVEKTTKKKHIEKADEKTQKKLKKLDNEMRSLAFTDSAGKSYLPRMAIVENKLSKSKQEIVEKIMKKFNCSESEATELV